MKVKALVWLMDNGTKVAPGTELDYPEAQAKQLEAEGSVELVDGEVDPGASNSGTSAQDSGTSDLNKNPDQVAAEELERVTKALDAQYKRDELAEAAKEAGVEFPYDAKKAEIIDAVIKQGKTQALLK